MTDEDIYHLGACIITGLLIVALFISIALLYVYGG